MVGQHTRAALVPLLYFGGLCSVGVHWAACAGDYRPVAELPYGMG